MLSQQFLRRLLESAYPADPRTGHEGIQYGLEGYDDHLMVTAPAARGIGSRGYYRYEVALRASPDGLASWVVTSHLDDGGPSYGAAGLDTLLTGVKGVQWSYLEPQEASQGSHEAKWVNEWLGRVKPPLLVRVRVVFPPGDVRRWPDLLIAPMITDSSSCVFDEIGQRCRDRAL
jgi:general secretion pathway protein J